MAGTPAPGISSGVDAPDFGDVFPRGRVGDHAVAGQLVGLLAVLATTLAIALAGDGAVAATFGTHESEHEREVDDGADRVGAVDVLLRAAAGEQERAATTSMRAGVGKRTSDAAQLGLGDPGGRGDALGPPLGNAAAHSVNTVDASLQVVGVGQRLGEHDVQQAKDQHEIGARHELQVLAGTIFGELGCRAGTRIHDDQPTTLTNVAEVLHGGRHGVGEVAAEQHHDVGVVEVGQREGHPAIDAQSPVGRGRGRRHAEPTVVVDQSRTQSESGELAELIGLLVGQASPAKHRDTVRSVARLDRLDPGGDVVERLVPADLLIRALGRTAKRCRDPVLRAEELGAGPALLAHSTDVGRERPRLGGDGIAAERLGALECAVGTVRVSHSWQVTPPPSPWWLRDGDRRTK